MADEQDDILDLEDEVQDQEPVIDEDDDEIVIELDGEEAAEEPPLVKKLRQEVRDRDRRLAEYTKPAAPINVGPKPTLESCDYDEDRYDKENDAWKDLKAKADKEQTDASERQSAQSREFQDLEVKYRASRAAITVNDDTFQAADDAVRGALSEQVILGLAKYTKDPAKVVLALGKYPARLAAIAAETDPLKQIFAIRDLEGAMKVTTRRNTSTPEAESIQRGSASASGKTVDKVAEGLLAKAMKDGDMTAYNRHMKAKKAAAK